MSDATITYCPNHLDTRATPCARCARPYCERCTYGSIEGMVCAACWSALRARRLRKLIGLGVAAAVVTAGGIAAIAMTAAHDSAPVTPVAVRPRDDGGDLGDSYREHLRQKPCTGDLIEPLLQFDLDKSRYRAVLADGYRYLGQCGTSGYHKVIWKISYAHQQLDQWLASVIVDAQLVIAHPDDSDYWWWRGEGWSHAGHPQLGLADLRQSIALSENAQAAGFATARIGDAAAAGQRLCEGARAWRMYERGFDGQVGRSGLDEQARLTLQGQCDQEDGTGTVKLALDQTGRGKAKVTIGGATGNLLVDPFAGTTLLTPAFAARAGVAPDGALPDRGESMMSGIRVAGAPALIPELAIAAAHARRVDALIVDGLPGGFDGVVGLSCFWHFDVARDESSITLTAPAP